MIRQAKTKTFNGNLDIRGRGNRTELVRTVFPFVDGRFGSGSKVNWEYDLTSQLSFERYKLANDTEFLTQEYLNDDAGNRETHNVNYFDQSRSVAGTYNAANELTGLEISSPSTSPTNVTFEHNKRGGRTKMTTNAGGSDSVVVNYGYNEDNSMTQYGVVAPGRQLNVAFAYSGGLRVEKQVTGFITTGGQQQVYNAHKKYLLDGVDVLLELQVIGSNTVVTALHIPGVLSATLIEGGASVVRYQLHDAQGNVVGLVDTDQEVGPVYLQDSWGIPLVDTDCQTVNLASSPVQVESVPNPYRWGGEHGYYADEDVGMYLIGFRWYDSFTGRFISRDPIGFAGGDMNLYRPMGNNPVNAVDPWGLQNPTERKWVTGFFPWRDGKTYRRALIDPVSGIIGVMDPIVESEGPTASPVSNAASNSAVEQTPSSNWEVLQAQGKVLLQHLVRSSRAIASKLRDIVPRSVRIGATEGVRSAGSASRVATSAGSSATGVALSVTRPQLGAIIPQQIGLRRRTEIMLEGIESDDNKVAEDADRRSDEKTRIIEKLSPHTWGP